MNWWNTRKARRDKSSKKGRPKTRVAVFFYNGWKTYRNRMESKRREFRNFLKEKTWLGHEIIEQGMKPKKKNFKQYWCQSHQRQRNNWNFSSECHNVLQMPIEIFRKNQPDETNIREENRIEVNRWETRLHRYKRNIGRNSMYRNFSGDRDNVLTTNTSETGRGLVFMSKTEWQNNPTKCIREQIFEQCLEKILSRITKNDRGWVGISEV